MIFLTSIYPRISFAVPVAAVDPFASGELHGGVAQLGERLNGIQEVRGSIPLTSMPDRLAVESGVRLTRE